MKLLTNSKLDLDNFFRRSRLRKYKDYTLFWNL